MNVVGVVRKEIGTDIPQMCDINGGRMLNVNEDQKNDLLRRDRISSHVVNKVSYILTNYIIRRNLELRPSKRLTPPNPRAIVLSSCVLMGR